MKLSYATAVKMGIKNGRFEFKMPTAYIMIGEKCVYNCYFCSQARESYTDTDYLSRVKWPSIDLEKFEEKFDEKIFRRICIQVVSSLNYERELIPLLEYLKNKKVDVSVSIRPKNLEEIKMLFEKYKIDRIGISVDVANEKLFKKIRGTEYSKYRDLMIRASKDFLHKVTTHVIVGLGETDEDIVKFMLDMKSQSILVSLFAFTPVKGTKLEAYEKPTIERYRKIQNSREIINKYDIQLKDFKFDNQGNLIELPKKDIDLEEAKKTSGCPWCTRPYYNETPGKVQYNIPKVRKNKEV
ncbi:radical SAM protein [Oceanotoga sp. DSM 15011]|uniref:Biotin synthase n=1 Tax=Oceanotoga teriensis TaxID=515440 RepID=A0AA45C9C4_9BACT|nr:MULTISPECIES: radical SAM protein [Oceanotoga]MDN5342912.1 lipoyl synthase [Oceanotoga sp.]MDO7975370.1 radical SAM protein [Oceanotoga teriensis]PWJ96702.1 biotin synthase [Oceanotoga teriensis]UYP00126.1 radical SAM protein [Oceanotoga sp. DSM 15011]